MKLKIKKLTCICMCVIIMIVSFGCSGKLESQSSDICLKLVDSPSTTLDNVWYNTGGIFRCAVFESLLIPSSDMLEMKMALARDYNISEDGLTYVFELRDDVKWHDGEKFDAEDVIYSFESVLRSEEVNGLFTSAFQYIEGADDYRNGQSEEISGIIVDGECVTVKLISPIGDFLDAIAQFAILPEHLLGNTEPNFIAVSDYWKKPIGCGCYKITEAVEGNYFILEANKDYYGNEPGIKKIHLSLNQTDCVKAMQEGNLDFYVTNDPEEISKLKGINSVSEHRLNILFPAYLITNVSDDEGVNESLKDIRVRKALLMAIDREKIVDTIFPGSLVSDTLVPSWADCYWDGAEKYEFNPQKAKSLLEEAGFDFSRPLRLRYFTKGQSTSDLMNAIAVYWRAIGINVDLQKFEGSGSEHMFEIRDFDICYKRLSAFDYAAIYEELQSEGVIQTKLFKQPVYDELINELEMTMDIQKRKEIIHKMQQLEQQHLFRMPLFAMANVAYVMDSHFSIPETYGNIWYRYDLCFGDWKLVK